MSPVGGWVGQVLLLVYFLSKSPAFCLFFPFVFSIVLISCHYHFQLCIYPAHSLPAVTSPGYPPVIYTLHFLSFSTSLYLHYLPAICTLGFTLNARMQGGNWTRSEIIYDNSVYIYGTWNTSMEYIFYSMNINNLELYSISPLGFVWRVCQPPFTPEIAVHTFSIAWCPYYIFHAMFYLFYLFLFLFEFHVNLILVFAVIICKPLRVGIVAWKVYKK